MSIRFFVNYQVRSFPFLLRFMRSLYILVINTTSDIQCANIFAHYLADYFLCSTRAIVSLVYFCFCCLSIWDHNKKIISITFVKEYVPYLFF